MAILTGLMTLGRDAELRETSAGSVATLALAYNYGRKDESGNKPTQWVRAALWGKQAEALTQYLTKGKQVFVTLRDVNVRTFESDSGTKYSLEGSVAEIEFARGAPQQAQQSPQPAQRAPQRPAPQVRQAPPDDGFSDMEDSIPF